VRPPYGWATGTLSNSLTTVGAECVSSAFAQSHQSSYNHQWVQSSISKTIVWCMRAVDSVRHFWDCTMRQNVGQFLLLCFTQILWFRNTWPERFIILNCNFFLILAVVSFFFQLLLYISQCDNVHLAVVTSADKVPFVLAIAFFFLTATTFLTLWQSCILKFWLYFSWLQCCMDFISHNLCYSKVETFFLYTSTN